MKKSTELISNKPGSIPIFNINRCLHYHTSTAYMFAVHVCRRVWRTCSL